MHRLLIALAVALSTTFISADGYTSETVFPDFSGRDRDYRSYRTRITEGMKSGPNFAKKYTVIEIGCGTGCRFAAVADNSNGELFGFPYGGEEYLYLNLEYTIDSNTVLISYENRKEKKCVAERLSWDGKIFTVEDTLEKSLVEYCPPASELFSLRDATNPEELPSQARAATDECQYIGDWLKAVAPVQLGKFFWVYTLKRDDKARYIILLESNETFKWQDETAWMVLAQRGPDRPGNYCILGRGEITEPLISIHTSNFSDRYGLPGSGYPRCSAGKSVMDDVGVRAWANKELGDSEVLSFTPSEGTVYTLLVANEGSYWILLDQKPGKGRCYLDRGDESSLRRIMEQDGGLRFIR